MFLLVVSEFPRPGGGPACLRSSRSGPPRPGSEEFIPRSCSVFFLLLLLFVSGGPTFVRSFSRSGIFFGFPEVLNSN